MAHGSDDDDFDQRLSLEIIPDAHDVEEQALGWFSYLEEHLQFPFQAEHCWKDWNPRSAGWPKTWTAGVSAAAVRRDWCR